MIAALCILGPLTLPVGVVPLSFVNLALLIGVYTLGQRLCVLSCAGYLLVGLVGLPVFSGFGSGFAKLAGPTGGYLVGYFFLTAIAGWGMSRFRAKSLQFLCIAGGMLVSYGVGTAWFCVLTGQSVAAAVGFCVLPFLPLDFIKIITAMYMGPIICKRLKQAKLYLR